MARSPLRGTGSEKMKGCGFTKKHFIVLLMALIMCGCSYGEETQSCDLCNKQAPVATLVYTKNDDCVCAKCFQENNYSKCISCGEIYQPGWDCYEGYCISCSETETWFCVVCEEYKKTDSLAQVADGYYMCADCVFAAAKPFDLAFRENFADYISPFDENKFEFSRRHDVLETESTFTEWTGGGMLDPDNSSYYFKDHDAWYGEGYDDGYDNGYENGYEDGNDEGYKKGLSEGETKGKQIGYENGYAAGKTDYQKSFTTAQSSVSTSQTKKQEITVYITNTGSKYHRNGCQYLHSSKIAINKSTAIARGYSACSRCY